ncbi:MAG: hypothetical protein J6Q78_04345, partial [Clostridia bacterium]|nr:hypothetical protein [Clostridia bacterium]
ATNGVRGFTALVAKCVSEDNITAATHDLYNATPGTPSPTDDRGWHRTLVSIPLSELVITKGEGDIFTTDISITATNSDQLTDRKAGSYVGTFEGVLAFDLNAQDVIKTSATMDNRSNSIAAGSTAAAKYYTADAASILASTDKKTISFDINVSAMTAYTLDEVSADLQWDWGAGRVQKAHIFMDFWGQPKPGETVLQLYNTSNGGTDGGESLVLVHKDITGKVTNIVLDKKVGDDLHIELIWNTDNSGSVIVNGDVLFETSAININNSCSITSRPTGGFYMVDYFGDHNNTDALAYTMTNINLASSTSIPAADPEVLTANAKLAYVQESAVVDDTYSIRLVGTINTIRASEAGFEVSVKGEEGEPTVYSSTTVYNSVYQNVSGEPELLNAPTGTKFFTAVIPSIAAVADDGGEGDEGLEPANAEPEGTEPEGTEPEGTEPTVVPGTITFIVKPYFISAGVTTYGDAYEITYINGVFQSATLVVAE